MLKHIHYRQKLLSSRAQAMIEFALVAPILFLMLIGIFEVGRMVFLYTAVTNASREAVRYGSALGYDEQGFYKYRHCEGIVQLARQAAYFTDPGTITIDIGYDLGPEDPVYSDGHGPDTDAEWDALLASNPTHRCDEPTGEDPNVIFSPGKRVLVRVRADYVPYTRLIPWPAREFRSTSARTILGYVALRSTASVTPVPTATSTPTETPIPTDTSIYTPTETPTDTPTPTDGSYSTLPPGGTPTLADTATPAYTFTATLPGLTSTATSQCGSVTASNIDISNKTMSTTITNLNAGSITITSVQVKWNPEGVDLKQVSLGGITLWSGTDTSGNKTIATSQIINGNSSSAMVVTLSAKYVNYAGTTITLNILVPGCGTYIVVTTPS